ncbi:Hydantoinase/oxoprolinase-domain-containing protein [Obelidium mucronatum]|nr:Hydantoinase/oxoprolinase-domain-containing protein [Obelidium mucronatum]
MPQTTNKIRVFIDRGGTFTDCIAFIPSKEGGFTTKVIKLLSEDPANYKDAPTEAIRRIKEFASGKTIPRKGKLDTSDIELIRMGTTVATNALLERKGGPVCLVVTKGFKDILHIQNQARPKIFDLEINMPGVLYQQVIEVDERVSLVGYTAHASGVVKEEDIPKGDENYAKGVTGEWVKILKKPDLVHVENTLKAVYKSGIRSIAICLMHSFTFTEHENQIAQIATRLGFTNVSTSSQTTPMIKLVPRGNSAVSDAYLTPSIKTYISGFNSGFDSGLTQRQKNEDGSSEGVRVQFMKSDGGLADVNDFNGLGAILSGPAGGVVGYALTSYDADEGTPVIGFDMGGTSTDVSRYAGRYDHVFETTTAGITIQAPQLDINTVAAGGGSRLFFRNGMFVVGPESAGANPGPTCYKKGGPLAITDANLLLGRLIPSYFPKIFGKTETEPLDFEATKAAFEELSESINGVKSSPKRGKKSVASTTLSAATEKTMSLDEIAYGFIEVANEAMCRPIRQLTQAKGHDTFKTYSCMLWRRWGDSMHAAIAKSLGIKKVLVHKHSAILSAYGLSLADIVHEVQEPVFDIKELNNIKSRVSQLSKDARAHLSAQGFSESQIMIEPYLNLRYQGTDTSIMTLQPENSWDFLSVFIANHKQEFGFTLPDRPVIIDDIRIRAIGKGASDGHGSSVAALKRRRLDAKSAESIEETYWKQGGRRETPVYLLSKLVKGDEIIGPALIIEATATIVVEPDCTAIITSEHVVILVEPATNSGIAKQENTQIVQDPILLSVFGHRFMTQTSKKRLDFSCALFGPDGGLVANAPHIPVHLGSMQEAVRWQMKHLSESGKIEDGDVLMTNHPAAGGSHLPDITIITPLVFFVASRGHHADIGGIQPGSMPPNSCELYQEGAAVKSFHLVKGGVFDEKGVTDILLVKPAQYEGCSGTRCLNDNLSDLKGITPKLPANQRGISLVQGLISEYGLDVGNSPISSIQCLRCTTKSLVPVLSAEDRMDDGSTIKLSIEINPKDGSATFDFTGTSREVYGNTNAPKSALLQPITVVIPDGSLLSPSENAAVVGGNVLTSQRLCDVILKAFGACAASQGCCNNFTFGSGGKDKDGIVKDGFGYYETIAGGSGAVHTHMTNTRITDPEILERRYPVLLKQFALRHGSGGEGKFKGGDGVIREFLETLNVSMLSERRVFQPYAGLNLLIRKNQPAVNFGGKNATIVHAGDVIRIETPGGGGYAASETDEEKFTPSKSLRSSVRLAGGSLAALEDAQRDF